MKIYIYMNVDIVIIKSIDKFKNFKDSSLRTEMEAVTYQFLPKRYNTFNIYLNLYLHFLLYSYQINVV